MEEKIVSAPSADLAALESRLVRSEQRLRVLCVLLALGFGLAAVAPLATPAFAQTVTFAQLVARVVTAEANIAALKTKTQDMSRLTDPNTGKPTVRFSAVNVQIVNGAGEMSAGYTAAPNPFINGVGNLIIGYNKKRANNTYDRNGSHMLIVGDFQNYTATAAANIVSGYGNNVSGLYSNATGYGNAVNGTFCNIGGAGNAVNGIACSVSGGGGNTASGFATSISGGQFQGTSGNFSSVSGGFRNSATNDYSSVSGGSRNTASGLYSSVSGGGSPSFDTRDGNTASGILSSVSAGYANNAVGGYSSVSGGWYNYAQGGASSISGGNNKTQTSAYGWTGGGYHSP